MINKQSEEKLRQLFKNRSDCYADMEDDSVVMAMSENGFIEVMNEALSIFDVSESIEDEDIFGDRGVYDINSDFGLSTYLKDKK